MRPMRARTTTALIGTLLASGCTGPDADGHAADRAERPAARVASVSAPAPAPLPGPLTAADSAALRARLSARADSVRAAFGRASALGASEVAGLRQDLNATQIATARTLGRRVSGEAEMERLRSEGRLVALADSTPYWILRDMDHSVPYVTPDAHAMLLELGRRFHARLDRLRLPRYRMKVTSALRTDETQAKLRKINSYASQTVSAHEFGTTVDVSHERFAAPAEPGTSARGAPSAVRPEPMEVEMLDSIGVEHSRVLQAELGRAIAEMRDGGALHVMMENRQPVYHMTVARRFPPPDAPRP